MKSNQLSDRESKLLAKLQRLHERRDRAARQLAAIEAHIRVASRDLARSRGVVFLRPEQVRREVEAMA